MRSASARASSTLRPEVPAACICIGPLCAFGALHEYDVVELLERLDQRGDGMLSLSSCTMTRNGKLRFDARTANVNAACELNWYTLRLNTDEG